jgi:hypothetical protein
LKTLKTAKGIFGKAWRIQGKNLEMLGVDLEMFGAGLEKLAIPRVIPRPRRAPAREGRSVGSGESQFAAGAARLPAAVRNFRCLDPYVWMLLVMMGLYPGVRADVTKSPRAPN